jgi:hypothetical protein
MVADALPTFRPCVGLQNIQEIIKQLRTIQKIEKQLPFPKFKTFEEQGKFLRLNADVCLVLAP